MNNIKKKILYRHINKCKTRRFGFTLAEVLITLAIIGVVAALTIPTLIQNQQERATVTSLKKAYSMLSQAYLSAVNDNGTPDNWGFVTGQAAANNKLMMDTFAPYLKVTQNCGNNTGCWPSVTYNYLNTTNASPYSLDTLAGGKAQLSDGTLLYFGTVNATCSDASYGSTPALSNACSIAIVDINGFKNPNQMGYDAFWFIVTKQGVVPMGTKDETSLNFAHCTDKSLASASGMDCAAWVIYNGNQDYLHCSDLSWDGKHKCS